MNVEQVDVRLERHVCEVLLCSDPRRLQFVDAGFCNSTSLDFIVADIDEESPHFVKSMLWADEFEDDHIVFADAEARSHFVESTLGRFIRR